MHHNNATLRFADGTTRVVSVRPEQTLLEGAEHHGVYLPSSCREGSCGACMGRCRSGGTRQQGAAVALAGAASDHVLPCTLTLNGDADFEFDVPFERCQLDASEPFQAEVLAFKPVAEGAIHLVLQSKRPLDYQTGQFLDLKVPGTESWRSYSFLTLPDPTGRIELLIRQLPESKQGVMSRYLAERARVGDRLWLRAGGGKFKLGIIDRPVILIAGGTGLSAILCQLRQLVAEQCQQPVTLLYGVNQAEELAFVDEIEGLGRQLPAFQFHPVVLEPAKSWTGASGFVTDCLDQLLTPPSQLAITPVDFYLCGPPPMIKAVESWLSERQHSFPALQRAQVHQEEFRPSGMDTEVAVPPAVPESRAGQNIATQGKPHRHAVVIGGSIAGMAAAQALSDKFDRVTVLEKDSHHPMGFTDFRASTSQANHAHHLLAGGQRVMNRLFPSFMTDFAQAGGNVVDASSGFRFYQNNGWKLVFNSGMKLCAGRRSLLEAVVRRQVETNPAIDYRYNARVNQLLLDKHENKVVGLVLEEGQGGQDSYQINADLVIDASGKNSAVLPMLEKAGYGRPSETHMPLRVAYTTVLYEVPQSLPDEDWTVMAVYNRRPVETDLGYLARYGDGGKMLVTLIQFNCDAPPRTHQEFSACLAALAQPHIADMASQSKPITPPKTFRYPSMFRRHFEQAHGLPTGLVAIGDALSSADPVSGAGMTKALLEIEQLHLTLEAGGLTGLEHDFYRRAARLTDDIWFVLGEQNFRYPWVEGKRPFGTRLINWYVDQVLDCAHYDKNAFASFMQVYHLNRRYTSLFAPAMLLRIARHTLTRSWRHVYRPAAPGEYRTPIVLD